MKIWGFSGSGLAVAVGLSLTGCFPQTIGSGDPVRSGPPKPITINRSNVDRSTDGRVDCFDTAFINMMIAIEGQGLDLQQPPFDKFLNAADVDHSGAVSHLGDWLAVMLDMDGEAVTERDVSICGSDSFSKPYSAPSAAELSVCQDKARLPYDLLPDGRVGTDDQNLLLLLLNTQLKDFEKDSLFYELRANADFDGNGLIDMADMAELSLHFGPACLIDSVPADGGLGVDGSDPVQIRGR
jgi:hypothetical protein